MIAGPTFGDRVYLDALDSETNNRLSYGVRSLMSHHIEVLC